LIEPYHLALSPSIIVYTLKYETKTPPKSKAMNKAGVLLKGDIEDFKTWHNAKTFR
jgi:hypothetical protein